MNKSFKHSVAGVIALALTAGPILFGFASPAHADLSGCLSGIFGSKTASAAQTGAATAVGTAAQTGATAAATANKVMAVPTSDAGVVAAIGANTTAIGALAKANASINSTTAAQTTGFTVQRCITEPLVAIMARALLDNFTAQTVRWINSGFQGSPLYVTNLQGFMSGVADQAVGQYIANLGPIGQILCSPFDLQLRLALNFQYSSGYYQEIGCRLSDIAQNVQRAFTGGAFGANGWDNWIQMAGTPQNNPYGAFLIATDNIDNQIASKINNQITQLGWGHGFLSSVDPATGKVSTPGTIIEGQLNATLSQPLQNVGLAKDIDAILGALVGQMINQVMGGLGGLAGGGGSYNYNTYSANDYTSGALAYNQQAQSLPDGLFMETGFDKTTGNVILVGPTGGSGAPAPDVFCAQFKKNIYGTADTSPTAASLVSVKVNGVADNTATARLTAKNGGAWTLADYNNVVAFCDNLGLTSALNSATSNYLNSLPQDTAPSYSSSNNAPQQQIDRQINLATAALNQSHIYTSGYDTRGPIHAAVGSGLSDTSGGATPVWWTASLNTREQVETVQVTSYSATGSGNGDFGVDYKIILANLPDSKMGSPIAPSDVTAADEVMEFQSSYPLSSAGVKLPVGGLSYSGAFDNLTLTLKTPVTANAIIISSPTRIVLTSVKMYRPAAGTNGTAAVGSGASQGPAFSFSPSSASLDGSYNATNRNFSNTFALSAGQGQNNLKASIGLFRVPASGADQPTQFSTVFYSGTLKVNGVAVDTSQGQSSAVFNPNFSLAQGDSVTETETGIISGTAVMNSANYPSYKLVMNLLDANNNVLAIQTTTFKIQ